MSAEEVGKALTSIGLEVEAVEEVQSIKGGLQGLVVGQVLTCEPHPNSDHSLRSTECCRRAEGHCGAAWMRPL